MDDDRRSQSGYPFASPAPAPTGGLIVSYTAEASEMDAEAAFRSADQGFKVLNVREFGDDLTALGDQQQSADAVLFPRFGLAVVSPGDKQRVASVRDQLRATGLVREVRPEFWMFAVESRDGGHADDDQSTWGVKAVGALASAQTGSGARIAVLDTGFDLNHPDFQGRRIRSQSFVPGESVQDGQGHGTHCIGTAAGRTAGNGVRYGVAPDAEIFVGKVLSNEGSGREAWILEGMEWAIREACHVISMSLGRPVAPGEQHSPDYESAGIAALEAGCLVIAAAGNESARRYNYVAPVGAPANSPSIMAVAALDSLMGVADFSCGGTNPGGAVDIAGPGVDVFSSVPMPRRHARLSGTSMATPHVAGVAALLAGANPQLRGQSLWDALVGSAVGVNLPARDAGRGFVSAS